ncbi:MAG: GTP-binding protein, partial [Candidatus Daviesbacteria bacterium]|nr:GTP-binding protein [Candidatus Daviesbacteria bacterium]
MNIRNFCIIAHVDHGKSTLADRFLEICHTVPADKMKPQLLDSLALERERGITIKLAPVRLNYSLNSIPYTLNLIDTPGHVDFSYEVSRSLAAVEGAILLVDATKGIQAQTLSHGLAATEQGLTLIPVINKIDLPNADIEKCQKELQDSFGFKEEEILLVSGKTGQGVDELLQAIIKKIPEPKKEVEKSLRALIFDSFFDVYKGVVAAVRIVDGETSKIGTEIKFLGTKALGQILEVGIFAPEMKQVEKLSAGEIGYITTGIKEPDKVHVGDTIVSISEGVTPLPGYKQVKPMVYVGLYPIDQDNFFNLKEALSKFKLNDPAFSFELEKSQ